MPTTGLVESRSKVTAATFGAEAGRFRPRGAARIDRTSPCIKKKSGSRLLRNTATCARRLRARRAG